MAQFRMSCHHVYGWYSPTSNIMHISTYFQFQLDRCYNTAHSRSFITQNGRPPVEQHSAPVPAQCTPNSSITMVNLKSCPVHSTGLDRTRTALSVVQTHFFLFRNKLEGSECLPFHSRTQFTTFCTSLALYSIFVESEPN
jgi:hypothetical protein